MEEHMSKIIGIISYLPNNTAIRRNRLKKLYNLIIKTNQLFNNLPTMIVAQNYTQEEVAYFSKSFPNLQLVTSPKLGISGARERLRELFLQTNYDVIILLDDDSIVTGEDGTEYLKQLDAHPGKICEMCKSRHKLMAIHRDIYKLQGYDLICTPENHIAYEDRLYFWTLIGTYGTSIHYKFVDVGLLEISKVTSDEDSSWSIGLSMSQKYYMNEKTNYLIEQRTGKKLTDIRKSIGYEL